MFQLSLGVKPEMRTLTGLTAIERDAIREARRRLDSPLLRAAREAARVNDLLESPAAREALRAHQQLQSLMPSRPLNLDLIRRRR